MKGITFGKNPQDFIGYGDGSKKPIYVTEDPFYPHFIEFEIVNGRYRPIRISENFINGNVPMKILYNSGKATIEPDDFLDLISIPSSQWQNEPTKKLMYLDPDIY